MPKTSKATASRSQRVEGIVDERSDELGPYTVSFSRSLGDVDGAPLLKGLPDDLCQCPHWGYVFAGRIAFRFPDREEVYEAGDAFYAPPGHSPMMDEGAEVLWFHPTEELAATMAVMEPNAQALARG
jgi:hypothetical protein